MHPQRTPEGTPPVPSSAAVLLDGLFEQPARENAETEEGMGPDDLLCSRNAHDKNVLVRRAHSRIEQATILKPGKKAAPALLDGIFEHPAHENTKTKREVQPGWSLSLASGGCEGAVGERQTG